MATSAPTFPVGRHTAARTTTFRSASASSCSAATTSGNRRLLHRQLPPLTAAALPRYAATLRSGLTGLARTPALASTSGRAGVPAQAPTAAALVRLQRSLGLAAATSAFRGFRRGLPGLAALPSLGGDGRSLGGLTSLHATLGAFCDGLARGSLLLATSLSSHDCFPCCCRGRFPARFLLGLWLRAAPLPVGDFRALARRQLLQFFAISASARCARRWRMTEALGLATVGRIPLQATLHADAVAGEDRGRRATSAAVLLQRAHPLRERRLLRAGQGFARLRAPRVSRESRHRATSAPVRSTAVDGGNVGDRAIGGVPRTTP